MTPTALHRLKLLADELDELIEDTVDARMDIKFFIKEQIFRGNNQQFYYCTT